PLVISLAAPAPRAGTERSDRYVQFALLGPYLRAESVGNQYLQGADRLTPDQLADLDRLGWNAPDDSGNHWRWFDPRDHLDAARLAVTTLHEVHGVDHPRQLTFDAAPHVLDLLRPPPSPPRRRRRPWSWRPPRPHLHPSDAGTAAAAGRTGPTPTPVSSHRADCAAGLASYRQGARILGTRPTTGPGSDGEECACHEPWTPTRPACRTTTNRPAGRGGSPSRAVWLSSAAATNHCSAYSQTS